ncbi:MAG: efflux RND transporter periplasmic adaptor subunit [Verrucomicrobiales bacterium]|nr:efflux RND transporter periplasmic adaptor subunit [Verrucomicrobiales bacterium]
MKTFILTLVVALSLTLFAKADPGTVLGYLEPYRSIDMDVAEVGVIGEIFVEEGNLVEEGDALLSLNNSVLEAQLEIASIQSESTAAVIVAQADLDVADERFAKLSKLQSSGTAHSSEVARALAEKKKAEGQLSIANEEKKIAGFRVEEIKAQIEKRFLRSPIRGIVLEINRDVAETATASGGGNPSKPLVRVARIDQLKLVVHVPSFRAEQLEKGKEMPVRVLQQSSLSLDRENSAIDTVGTIEFVSPAIDPSSETIRTRLVLENANGALLSGSHALVLFE